MASGAPPRSGPPRDVREPAGDGVVWHSTCGYAECVEPSRYAADSTCKGCRRIKYCTRECQKADWKRHKPACKADAAADEAAALEGALVARPRARPPPPDPGLLIKAAADGNVKHVEALLRLGADVNSSNSDGGTPLHAASFAGHSAVVSVLLASPGIAVNAADKDGFTPLFVASQYGHAAVVTALVVQGAVHATNENGATPLYIASQNGHTAVVTALLTAPEKLDAALELLASAEAASAAAAAAPPSPALAAALAAVRAAASAAARAPDALSKVSSDAAVLADGLTALHAAAEGAVRGLRALDAQSRGLGALLETLDGVLELHAATAAADAASAAGDADALALALRRFRAVARALPAPAPDAARLADAEDGLVARTLADFDAAVARGDGGDAPAIERACATLALLDRGGAALQRYAEYLQAALAREARGRLVAAAEAGGLGRRAAGVNLASAIFAAAAGALDGPAAATGAALGGEARGPPAVLAAVAAAVDAPAARAVRSFARGARVAAALRAREAMLAPAAAGGEGAAAAAARRARAAAAAAAAGAGAPAGGAPPPPPPPPPPTPAAVARLLAAVDDAGNDAPLAGDGGGGGGGTLVDGGDLAEPRVYDAFLDEVALLLQRCTSFARLLASRGGAGVAPALAGAAGELASVYAALETAGLRAGVATATLLDEPLPDGAWGAGVELMDAALLTAPAPATALAAALSAGGERPGASGGAAGGGGGATHGGRALPLGGGTLAITLVEDAGYVCRRAASRALATGSADAAASVLSAVAFALGEGVLGELDARLKVAAACDSVVTGGGGGAGGGGGGGDDADTVRAAVAIGLSRADGERFAAMRRALGRAAAAALPPQRLAAYANLGLPGAAGVADADGYGGGTRVGGGPGGDGGTSMPSGLAGGGAAVALPATVSNSTPGARLTDDVAAVAGALVGLQTAAEVADALASGLASDAAAVFTDARESAKIAGALSGLRDAAGAARRALDAGLAAALSRLTPRLRSALHVFEGAAALVSYDIASPASGIAGLGSGGGQDGAGALIVVGSAVIPSSGSNCSPAVVSEFLPVLGAILAPFAGCATPSLAAALSLRVAGYIAKQLEPRIRRKRVSAWGAIALDADIRATAAFFAARSSRRARDRFARLLAIAAVLGVEAPSDVPEVLGWSQGGVRGVTADLGAGDSLRGGGGGGWAELLAPAEVRDILLQRVEAEFSPSSIDSALAAR